MNLGHHGRYLSRYAYIRVMGIRYNPALDGIRAFAVIGVILYHTRVPGFSTGWLGVTVFFVLSGYLITTILAGQHRAGTFRLVGFYIRRARRLYPALLAATLMFLLAVSVWDLWPEKNHGLDALLVVTYLSDYGSAFWNHPGVLRHTWTLSVEEHYYLLWPIVLAWLLRTNRLHWLPWMVVAATAWRFASMHYIGVAQSSRLDSHADALLLGSLLAFVPLDSARWGRMAMIFLPVAVALDLHGLRALSLTAGAVGAMGLVAWAVQNPRSPAWLAYVGKISYGLYLYHYLIVRYLRETDTHWLPMTALTLALTFALAMLSYHTIEAYFRRPVRASGTVAYSPPS